MDYGPLILKSWGEISQYGSLDFYLPTNPLDNLVSNAIYQPDLVKVTKSKKEVLPKSKVFWFSECFTKYFFPLKIINSKHQVSTGPVISRSQAPISWNPDNFIPDLVIPIINSILVALKVLIRNLHLSVK